MSTIYLDSNGGARLRNSAKASIESFLQLPSSKQGNPSSIHTPGRFIRGIFSQARRQVQDYVGAPARVIFTSGGTESILTLHHGFVPLPSTTKGAKRIVVSAIEHEATRAAMKQYLDCGFEVEQISAERTGVVDSSKFLRAVIEGDEPPALVSLMAANNVSGVVQPIDEIARTLRASGYRGPIVSDAVQLVAKSSLRLRDLFAAGVNGVAISGHKVGALSGIGAVLLNQSDAGTASCLSFEPFIVGGSQEERYRGGTENLLGALTLGAALREISLEEETEIQRMKQLRDRLAEGLHAECPGIEIITPLFRNETGVETVCNTLSVRFSGIRADDFVVGLDLEGVYCSTGSACSSGKQEISHVYLGMGLSQTEAAEVIRFSLDWQTSADEISEAITIIARVFSRMRMS